MDAIYSESTAENLEIVMKLFYEIKRVLKSTGFYICISLLQNHILKSLKDNFSDYDCTINLLQVDRKISSLCPFIIFIKTSKGEWKVTFSEYDGFV